MQDKTFVEVLQSEDFQKRLQSFFQHIIDLWANIQTWAISLDDHDALIVMQMFDEEMNHNLFGDERYEQLQPLIEGGNDA